jgi:hypothetical protein
MNSRFSFPSPEPEPPPADSKIIQYANKIKLTLYRSERGNVYGRYAVQGDFGSLGGGDFESEKDIPADEGLRFIRGLITQFEQSQRESGDGGLEMEGGAA